MAFTLGFPCMIKAVPAEEVLTGELDRLVEGGVAYEANEVAVRLGNVFEEMDIGRLLGNGGPPVL